MRSDLYQYALIFLGVVATLFFGAFLYREIYPEYRIYQNDYIALEEFRSSYSGEPPLEFQEGVKQIVFERDDKGPPVVDRCISCHVALQIPAFSPTKITKDLNGNVVLDEQGFPVKVKNEDYIWDKLDAKILELESQDPKKAEELRALKTAKVDEHVYDVTKALRMHPLMGRETRPFEYHPIEEYGCTSCHNGNGKGLTTEKAHGPLFDGEYETEFIGPEPEFVEKDPANDPSFSKAYNYKPGHKILFQTTPLFVGALIQAKCVQCHQTSEGILSGAMDRAGLVLDKRLKRSEAIKKALNNEKLSVIGLLEVSKSLKASGFDKTLSKWHEKANNYMLAPEVVELYQAQERFLIGANQKKLSYEIDEMLIQAIGSKQLLDNLEKKAFAPDADMQNVVDQFLVEHRDDAIASGTLFKKFRALDLDEQLMRHVEDAAISASLAFEDQGNISALQSDIDLLTKEYSQGKHLYLSQACYACHKISGFSRGGVGPELTREGLYYPWYIKKKMAWPQFDLKTSTMPNMKIDHEELEGLMTFLLAQQGPSKAISDNQYKVMVQEWEAGKKQPWEQPVPPIKIHDLNYAMTVFATEGCAACHRLKGFESNVGYQAEIEAGGKADFETRFKESQWFEKLIPEDIAGTDLVKVIESNKDEIDKRIVDGVRENSLLEAIEKAYPGTVESYNTPFKFALRAKNAYYAELAAAEKDKKSQAAIWKELEDWKARVHRVLMVYAQEYGLGRLIGPRPNWSGVYRTDEWLMEHFKKPTGLVPNSIMPALPFDDTKFYSLTYMLDVLGQRNRDAVKAIWENRGFNPEMAFEIHCAQCHGPHRNGNGPVAQWIYPIPKNLRNADFLRNLTKERVIVSIHHGVKGTPMPPWGEAADDKQIANKEPVLSESEIRQLADWLFLNVPGASVIKGYEDVPKWQYTPEDVLKELEQEGGKLKSSYLENFQRSEWLKGSNYYAALEPHVAEKGQEERQEIFDVDPPPVPGGPDKHGYYIKKEYYTDANLAAGKAFFELNCAVCHGAEGDGKGIRAEVMQDAKPRMLSNLSWIHTRDDLRLLRSIKYGVPGTAMTPWGDLTSSLQRLQLVMFIRNLSEESEKRTQLSNALYKSFTEGGFAIETARGNTYKQLSDKNSEYKLLQKQQRDLQEDPKKVKEALANYQKLLDLQNEIKDLEEKDQALTRLKEELLHESEVYQSMGQNLIIKPLSDSALESFNQIVLLQGGRYKLEDGELKLFEDTDKSGEAAEMAKTLLKAIENKLELLEKEKTRMEGRIASSQTNQELSALSALISSYRTLQKKMIAGFEEANRSRLKQNDLYKKWKSEASKK